MLTASRTTRLAPACFARLMAFSKAWSAPEMTTCPGQLSLAI